MAYLGSSRSSGLPSTIISGYSSCRGRPTSQRDNGTNPTPPTDPPQPLGSTHTALAQKALLALSPSSSTAHRHVPRALRPSPCLRVECGVSLFLWSWSPWYRRFWCPAEGSLRGFLLSAGAELTEEGGAARRAVGQDAGGAAGCWAACWGRSRWEAYFYQVGERDEPIRLRSIELNQHLRARARSA